MTPEQLAIKNVGKQDPKRHLEEKVDTLMSTNIVQCLGELCLIQLYSNNYFLKYYLQYIKKKYTSF